jgi:predicted  nucleic acid-binding Zn-ribbon protein
VELLRSISRLSTELGLNLAGVEVILRLNQRIHELQTEVERLQHLRASLEMQITILQEQIVRQEVSYSNRQERIP